MLKKLHQLSRRQKQFVILGIDFFIIIFAIFLSYYLRLGEWYVPKNTNQWLVWATAPVIAIPIFIRFGLFKAVIEYVEYRALWTIVQAVTLYALVFGLIMLLSGVFVPRSVVFINWMVALVLIFASRIIGRQLFSRNRNGQFFPARKHQQNIIVYGAGSSGAQLVHSLGMSNEMNPVAFVDDEESLHKHYVSGLRVYSPKELESLISKYNVKEILLAMPSASRSRIAQVLSNIDALPVLLRTLPAISDLAEGKVTVSDIREVEIDELLGRDQVDPDHELLHANIDNKVVMVTGAGGSIGSELCRQIIVLGPAKLILFEQSEYNLYVLEKEFVDQGLECVAVLGSVVDQTRVLKVCQHFDVQTIYHAAAYKHVPLVEKNPSVGVINNVMGTLNAAKAAIQARVEVFVLISTDKAVRPTNVMGASKRFAELVLQGLQLQREKGEHKTRFTMVRFGNVLGSSGSVVPYFRGQIKNGGPVTVTHKDIIRYFMTIPEAAQLVIQAGAMGQGGDVFVLDMGEPVKIIDLAKQMIHLSGLEVKDKENPAGDIEIRITGLRPGEKLYEELLIGDNVSKTRHPGIMRAEEDIIPWEQLQIFIDEINFVGRHNDSSKVRDVLMRVVKGYKPQSGDVDVLLDKYDGSGEAKTA